MAAMSNSVILACEESEPDECDNNVEVPAPGPSFNRARTTEPRNLDQRPPKRTEVKDCQWWIKQTVAYAVKAGVLLPLDRENEGESPEQLVERLPRH